MRLNDGANERLWDSLLTELLTDDCKKELSEFSDDGSDYSFSDGFEKRLKRIRRSVGMREALKSACRVVRNGAVAAASVLGVCFLMLLTQPKIYAAMGEAIREVFSDHDSYSYQGEFEGELDDRKRLGYVPTGYKLRNIDYVLDTLICLCYRNEFGDSINFEYGIASECTLSVYKNGREFKEKKIGGMTYYLYMSSENSGMYSYIVWYDGDYALSVSGQLDEDEIVKIAENVTG